MTTSITSDQVKDVAESRFEKALKKFHGQRSILYSLGFSYIELRDPDTKGLEKYHRVEKLTKDQLRQKILEMIDKDDYRSFEVTRELYLNSELVDYETYKMWLHSGRFNQGMEGDKTATL